MKKLIWILSLLLLCCVAQETSYPTKRPTGTPTSKPTTLFPTKRPTGAPTSKPTITAAPFNLQSPPNVLLMIADDFKPILQAYGSPFMSKHHGTPNLDSLAEQGVSFMNAHTQMALCGPSRASFFTSLRPNAIKVTTLKKNILDTRIKESKKTKNKEILLLPKLFKLHGYRTLGMGKIFHNNEWALCDDLDVWSEPTWTNIEGLKRPMAFNRNPINKWVEAKNVDDDYYADGKMSRLAAKMILEDLTVVDQKEVSPQPWMLIVGFYNPHLPFHAPIKYFERAGNLSEYPTTFTTSITNLATRHVNIAKGVGCDEIHAYHEGPAGGGLGFPFDTSDSALQEANRAYHAVVMYLDAQVGIVMDALRASRAENDTIVVLMGDHGFHLGDHGLYCKHSNFEQATKSPLIISPALRDVQAPRNAKSYAPVELLDLMPTLKEMAQLKHVNLSKYRAMQGQSLVSALADPQNGFAKPAAYSQYWRLVGDARMQGYTLRTTRYRFTKWTGKQPFTELYDYLLDPGETISLHKNKTLVNLLTKQSAKKSTKESTIPFDFAERQAMSRAAPLSTP